MPPLNNNPINAPNKMAAVFTIVPSIKSPLRSS
jgi:hypothetical protein